MGGKTNFFSTYLLLILIAINIPVTSLEGYDPDKHFNNPTSPENETMLTNLGSEPSCVVAGCVNVISGCFNDYEVDLTIPAPEPFVFSRSYSSMDTTLGVLRGGWHINHEGKMVVVRKTVKKRHEIQAHYLGPHGSRNHFEERPYNDDEIQISLSPTPSSLEKGVTNAFQGQISAHTNPKLVRFEFNKENGRHCQMRLGSGELHEFKTLIKKTPDYRLYSVTKPSGFALKYEYHEEGWLKKCSLYNRAGQDVGSYTITKPNPNTSVVTTPDGRNATYHFMALHKSFPCLSSLERSDGPPISYQLEKGDYSKDSNGNIQGYRERIIQKDKPEGRFLKVDYYRKGYNVVGNKGIEVKSTQSRRMNRVLSLMAPVGPDSTPIQTQLFFYTFEPDRGTKVVDAYGNSTLYKYGSDLRLNTVFKCIGDTPYTKERLYWHHAQLHKRSFKPEGANSSTYKCRYEYDYSGNITKESLEGKITGLPGKQTKEKICTYTSDGLNLIASIQEGDFLKEFTYYKDSNLLKTCFYSDQNGIFTRYFYKYDDNGMVIQSIVDDGVTKDKNNLLGVTERKIEKTKRSSHYPVGLPIEVTTYYLDLTSGAEVPIQVVKSDFDPQGRLICKTMMDGNHQLLRAQVYAYDAFGNLILEQNSNGDVILKDYDLNGNLIKEEGPLPNFYKTFLYDYSNRLIQINEHHPDGTLSQKFSYNYLGHRIQSVDPLGNVTDYEYDPFGRLLKEIGPSTDSGRRETKYSYNELSYPISVIDPNGNTTRTAYTIFGKPYRVEYPDGSQERTEYNLDSLPIVSYAKNGIKTVYTRDSLGRVLKTEIFSSDGTLLALTEAVYNAFHLLSETDPEGNITTYNYDFRGRKISCTKGDQSTHFEYDQLDRVIRIIQDDLVFAVDYDPCDRILEERKEDLDGKILTSTRYEYDPLGRKTLIDAGEGKITRYTYDTHGNLVKIIDPEGNETTTETKYGPRYVISTTTNPKGIQTISSIDANGKIFLRVTRNSFGVVLHTTLKKYDLCGNCIEITDSPQANKSYIPNQNQKFEYDCMNRLTVSVQGAGTSLEKRSEIKYNSFGQKERIIKPDGTQILHTYDALGRLLDYFSSSFHYKYTYDLNSNPIRVEDLIHQTKTTRTYNLNNHLTSETLQNGVKIEMNRTPHGQLTSLLLPDQTSVHYTYQSHHIKTAERISSNGASYVHSFDQYDTSGQIQNETLIHQLGMIERQYTPSGRLGAITSPFFSEMMTQYDATGNLLSRDIKDPLGEWNECFNYDHLNQLTKEEGVFSHSYTYDSMQNRLSKDGQKCTFNILNQFLSDQESQYSYDLSGNLIQITSSEGNRFLHYDALDRLIKVELPHSTIEYTYDEMNRCLSRDSSQGASLRFFYLNQIEIGATDSENKIVQFQLLGPGRKTEPCSAVAIEIDGIPYAPIHDQSGHIRCLIDPEGQPAATYRYSAFGEMITFSSLANPWTFAGKRIDPETGYILFGRRFYDPSLGRWLTQDPAGYDFSPNLYAYLSNSPLIHYDAFGLYESPFISLANQIASLPRNLFSFSGSLIHKLGRNIIPIPIVKDIPMAAGYFLQNGTLKGYTPSYNEPHSRVITAGGSPYDSKEIGHASVNGMGNTLDKGMEMAEQSSASHGGQRVYHAYCASHGFTQDLCEVGLQMLGVRTHQVAVTEQAIQMAQGSLYTTIDCHSRGGRSVNLALRAFSPEQHKTFWIATYGSAKIIDGPQFAASTNYISNGDFVPMLADPFKYAQARLFGNPNVKFLHALESGFDHDIGGKTYSKAMEKNAEDFNIFIGLR